MKEADQIKAIRLLTNISGRTSLIGFIWSQPLSLMKNRNTVVKANPPKKAINDMMTTMKFCSPLRLNRRTIKKYMVHPNS